MFERLERAISSRSPMTGKCRPLLQSVRLGFSLSKDAAVSSALDLLGFGRATQRISSAVEDRLALLLEENRVSFANAMVTPAPDAVRT